jgi:uncharacterized protein (DUF885 family)
MTQLGLMAPFGAGHGLRGPLFLVFMLSSLSALAAPSSSQSPAETRFEQLSKEFVKTHFAFRPLEAVALGWHEYDGQFVVPDQAALDKEVQRLKRFESAFAEIPTDSLSPVRREDLALVRAAIAGQRWTFETQQSARLNPMYYAGALDLSIYLKRDFKPLANRVESMTAILRKAPALFAAARANLAPVLPRPFVETAIEVAQGTRDFIDKDIAQAVATLPEAGVRTDFEQASKLASLELRSYIEWLKREKLPSSNHAFALGPDGYRKMLASELVDLSPDQILAKGLEELQAEQKRFAAAASVIAPSKKPIDVFKSIQREHPTAANLIPDARLNLDNIRQFVVDNRIVSLPGKVRPLVEETLPPFRSTSFASMDTPGPFEKRATEAYYYVTPVEPDWSPRQAEEWLTAFNYYTMDIVSIHEVYPGHYAQFLALNASPATELEKIFYSYPFVEGWAHYAEQMMMEQGFGQVTNPAAASHEDLVRAAKYRLAQSDEALLRLCRLCCSIKLHTQGMTVDQATRFFMDNCYYEAKPAHSEAMRGTFDPGYLYYTLGKLMILKLRADWESQEGPAYTLDRFHDEFLRHGAPPIPLLRKVLLKDPEAWPQLL